MSTVLLEKRQARAMSWSDHQGVNSQLNQPSQGVQLSQAISQGTRDLTILRDAIELLKSEVGRWSITRSSSLERSTPPGSQSDLGSERVAADHGRQLAEVRRLYLIENDSAVFDVFETHRYLSQTLIDAFPQLQSRFGRALISVGRALEEHEWQMLDVTVHWAGTPKAALGLLDEFDNDWWLAHSYPSNLHLTFTYKLV